MRRRAPWRAARAGSARCCPSWARPSSPRWPTWDRFGNYGWAIVAVTVLINLALSPLRFYSSKKMKKAAKHQPRMKELQDRMKKLKENPKKNERELQDLQQEQLALMKEANPLGGCMPLLLQMPIFWAVYLYLGSSLDVRHAPWVLWIRDLSTPDPLKILPISHVRDYDCLDQADATTGVRRSVDEDAAHNDDLADADHAHLAVLLFGAKRAGSILDGQQLSRSLNSVVDQSDDCRSHRRNSRGVRGIRRRQSGLPSRRQTSA